MMGVDKLEVFFVLRIVVMSVGALVSMGTKREDKAERDREREREGEGGAIREAKRNARFEVTARQQDRCAFC